MCVGGSFSYPNGNKGRLQKGYELFKKESWCYDRDFWIGQSLGSGNKVSDAAHSFRSFSNKMMAYLSELSRHPDGRGVIPRSIKLTTTPNDRVGTRKR